MPPQLDFAGVRRRQPPLRDRGRVHPAPARRAPEPVPLRGDQRPQEAGRPRPITEFIPNPTFEVVARPGVPHGLLRRRQPRGEDAARADRRADALDPRVPRARAPASSCSTSRASTPALDVPDPRQPHRGAAARRSRAHPGRDPRVQRVAVRRLGLRLRGPDLRHADRQSVHARRGHRRARAAARAGRQGGAAASGAGQRAARAAFAVPARVRSVLGAGPGGRRAGGPARVRQRLPGLPQHLGGHRAASTSRSGPRPSPTWPTAGGRSRTRSPRRSATGCSPRFPGVQAHQRRERRQLGRERCSSNLELAYKKMPRSSPSTRSRCSGATSGSTRSGRTRSRA